MFKSNFTLLGFCFFFVLLKIISIFLTDFNLHGDEAQYWLWSKKPDFGYFSKPPLLAWFVYVVCYVFGNSFFVIKMIPVGLYCVTSYLIFILTNILWKDRELALCTAIVFFLMPAVTLSSFILSTDILLVFFWILGMIQILKIKQSPNLLNFILLGFALGMAFLTKYAAIYFIFSLILLLIFEKKIGNIFLTHKSGFFLFVITTLIILAPNIVWNYNHDWITFGHTSDNASLNKINFNLFGGIEFLSSQIIMIGPIVFFAFFYYLKKNLKIDFITKFLIYFWAPSFIIVLVESFLVRAHANWAAVSLISLLILIVDIVYKANKNILFINNYTNLFVGIVFFILIGLSSSSKVFDPIRNMEDLVNLIKINTSNHKNNLVVGDRMLYANLSYEFFQTNTKIYSPFTPGGIIGHHFQLKNPLPDDFNTNFILIGYEKEINYLVNKNSKKLLSNNNFSFSKDIVKIYEVTF